MKLEELLPQFHEGARIRLTDWNKEQYIDKYTTNVIEACTLDDNWELYIEPINLFQDVIHLLNVGHHLRRKSWHKDYYIFVNNQVLRGSDDEVASFEWDDIIATNWEVVQ